MWFFNSDFNSDLLKYDENYDNTVPSSIFHLYNTEIIDYLSEKNQLEDGFIIDIGCGKGTFLNALCENVKNVRGLGINPSIDDRIISKN